MKKLLRNSLATLTILACMSANVATDNNGKLLAITSPSVNPSMALVDTNIGNADILDLTAFELDSIYLIDFIDENAAETNNQPEVSNINVTFPPPAFITASPFVLDVPFLIRNQVGSIRLASVQAIPEPGIYALMLAGLCLLNVMSKRKKPKILNK